MMEVLRKTLSREPEWLIPAPAETLPKNSCGLRDHSRGQKAHSSEVGAQLPRSALPPEAASITAHSVSDTVN
jgi:hypothetical protein